MFHYVAKISERIISANKIAIYGARIVAKEVYYCLQMKPYEKKAECFIVTDLMDNPNFIDGIPVITVDEAAFSYKHDLILVAVLERYVEDIQHTLDNHGFDNIVFLTFECDDWCSMRGNIFENLAPYNRRFVSLDEVLGGLSCRKSNKKVNIYKAVSHFDKKTCESAKKFSWEIPIQVGAAFTETRLADIRDDMGVDNIADKNNCYSELTGLYWLWKNAEADYIGLCHYRRHFLLDNDTIKKIGNSGLDAILTVPIFNFPTVKDAYYHDHDGSDWEIMKRIILEKYPDYEKAFQEMQSGHFYFAYNMMIAKKDVLNAYCEFLFPILFACEQEIGRKEDRYQNRYAGFLSERLMTVFFLHNEQYKVAVAEKHFAMN